MTGEKKLNPAQLKAIKHDQGPILVVAGAGTGKTTVITERIAHLIKTKKAKPAEILALTFTEKAAAEMEERVDQLVPYGFVDTQIMTFHAFGDLILREFALAAGLLSDCRVLSQSEQILFLRKHISRLGLEVADVQSIIKFISRLKDENVTAEEFSIFVKNNRFADRAEKQQYLKLARVYEGYERLMSESGTIDFGDQILKPLRLLRQNRKIRTEIRNRYKYILVDEYQDTNYAQNLLLDTIINTDKNLMVVGDDDQCLPGASKISTPAGSREIRKIKTGDRVVTAIGKGHLGVSSVKKIGRNKKLQRLLIFKTEGGNTITVTNNHKLFCHIPIRTKGYWYIYLMERQNLGWRLGVTNDLITRLRLERSADRIIGLRACKSEAEARYYEMLWALKYSMPTGCFKERSGIAIKGRWLNALYSEIDTRSNAIKLASDLDIDLSAHHFCLDGVVRGQSRRVKININICRRLYRSKIKNRVLNNPKITHELNVQTSDPATAKALDAKGFVMTKTRIGKRLRITSTNSEYIKNKASIIQKLTDGIIENKFIVGLFNKKTSKALVMPASNVLEGHYLPIVRNNEVVYDKIISKKEKIRKITTYDLEVEKTHNFIAEGVIIHNSIYKFRGAAISNILQFTKHYPKAQKIVLTQNYRSTQAILDSAYELIQANNPDRLEVTENIDKKLIGRRIGIKPQFVQCQTDLSETAWIADEIIDLVKNQSYRFRDIAILTRTHQHAHWLADGLRRAGIPYLLPKTTEIWEEPLVKALIAFAKTLVDYENDLNLFELLTSDLVGIAPKDLVPVLSHAKRFSQPFRLIIKNNDYPPRTSNKLKTELNQISATLDRYTDLIPRLNAGQIIWDFLKSTGRVIQLERRAETDASASAKIANLAQFLLQINTALNSIQSRAISELVDILPILQNSPGDTEPAEIDPNLEAVNILTAHSAKGLEFPIVIMPFLTQGKFPARRQSDSFTVPDKLIKERLPRGNEHLEEERRLFYVALTRAKSKVYLTASSKYQNQKRAAKLSRFVIEALGSQVKNQTPIIIEQTQKLRLFDYGADSRLIVPPQFRSSKIIKLSVSQIAEYQICPKKFEFRWILNLQKPISAKQTSGTAIHSAIKTYFGAQKSQKIMLNAYEKAWTGEGFNSPEEERKQFTRGKKILIKFAKFADKIKLQPVAVEQPFIAQVNKIKITGRYDAVTKNTIIDFKTSQLKTQADATRRAKDSLQLKIYALAWLFAKGEPITTTLLFVEPLLMGEVAFDQTIIEQTKQEIIRISRGIKKGDFAATPSYRDCRICDYKTICPWKYLGV